MAGQLAAAAGAATVFELISFAIAAG